MIFNVATAEELSDLTALLNSTYRGESSRAGWTTEADFFAGARTTVTRIERELAAGPGRLFITLREAPSAPIIGCVYLAPNQADETCYLGMLAVSAQSQAQGLGRALLTAAEAKASDLGARSMELRVLSPRSELMAWYERHGYSRTGEISPFPYREAAEDLPTRLDLEFVHFRKNLKS
jgi:ribosomal protein S18 acetylase RimI-like enzyme